MWERGADAWAWARVRAAGERRKRALRSEREVRAGRAVREKGWAEEKGDWAGRGRERRRRRAGLPGLAWAGGVWQFGLGCISRFGFGLGLLLFFSFSNSNSNQTKLI